MGIVGTFELPARMSPCLRLFIEMLFDDLNVRHGASWHQNHEVPSAIQKVDSDRQGVSKTALNRVA
jgi:hypothetical protein